MPVRCSVSLCEPRKVSGRWPACGCAGWLGGARAYLEFRTVAVAAHLRRRSMACAGLEACALRVPLRHRQRCHLPAADPHQAQGKHGQWAEDHRVRVTRRFLFRPYFRILNRRSSSRDGSRTVTAPRPPHPTPAVMLMFESLMTQLVRTSIINGLTPLFACLVTRLRMPQLNK